MDSLCKLGWLPTLTPLETSRNFLKARPNSLTHLRFLGGPEGEEDGKVRRELPGEGLGGPSINDVTHERGREGGLSKM